MSVCPSVRIEQLGSHWTVLREILYVRVFRKYGYNRTEIKGTLHEDQYAVFILSRSFLYRMRMFQTKVVEKIKAHILCSVIFFFEKRAVYEIM